MEKSNTKQRRLLKEAKPKIKKRERVKKQEEKRRPIVAIHPKIFLELFDYNIMYSSN